MNWILGDPPVNTYLKRRPRHPYRPLEGLRNPFAEVVTFTSAISACHNSSQKPVGTLNP